MHVKTIIFVAGVALGIIVGYGSKYATEIIIAALLLAAVQIGIYVIERKRKTVGLALSLSLFLIPLGIVVGALRVQLENEKTAYTCQAACTFDARVISSPESKDTYQRLVVRPSDSNEETYNVQLRVPLYPTFRIGETVRVSGKVTEPSFIYPHSGEKSFDYLSYLHTRNIGSEMLFPKIEVIDSEAHTVREILGRWKEGMIGKINIYVSTPASVLASGMLFGDSSMSKELTDTFRTAGLSHIIVLSGFNIAIVISFVLFVFAFVPLTFRIASAALFVVLFVLMVGGEASVLRATCMAFVSLLSTVLGRAYVAKQALIVSLLTIIMYEPSALLSDVSLHLSFLATAGIVYLSDPVKIFFKRYFTNNSYIELCTTTVSAYVATLPFVMYTFGTVSVYALLANLLALPFVPVAMLFSFLTVLFSYVFIPLAQLFGFIDSLLINIILFIAQVTEKLPLSSISFTISSFSMVMFYGAMVLSIIFLSRRTKNETLHTTQNGYLTDVIKY